MADNRTKDYIRDNKSAAVVCNNQQSLDQFLNKNRAHRELLNQNNVLDDVYKRINILEMKIDQILEILSKGKAD